MRSIYRDLVLTFLISGLVSACSMGEEMRRIEESKQKKALRDASLSTNLTGEQVFVRSCNTCHPGGKQGMGPSLENLAQDFPSDQALKKFIRKGKGMMPEQGPDSLNDAELDNLVSYLRVLSQDLNEKKKKS